MLVAGWTQDAARARFLRCRGCTRRERRVVAFALEFVVSKVAGADPGDGVSGMLIDGICVRLE